MDKEAAVAYLSTLADFADVNSQAALSAYLSKKQGKTSSKTVVEEEAELAD
jgi:predicted transcriptional regulator